MGNKLIYSLLILNILLGVACISCLSFMYFDLDYSFTPTATQGHIVASSQNFSESDIEEKPSFLYDFADIEDINTIALFGIDACGDGTLENGNSDAIVLVRLNHEDNTVKLISIYRDTCVEINEDGKFRKINYAYMMGGADKSIEVIKRNFDIDIDEYISIDFDGMIEVVNLLEGIPIEINEEESEILGIPVGLQTLNGDQALAYCRLRKAFGDDFRRSERQRIVLSAILAKTKEADLKTLEKLASVMLPYVKTSLNWKQILAFIVLSRDIEIEDIAGFPYNIEVKNYQGQYGYLNIPCTLETNVLELHDYLNEGDYEASKEVKRISKKLKNFSGYDADDGFDIRDFDYD